MSQERTTPRGDVDVRSCRKKDGLFGKEKVRICQSPFKKNGWVVSWWKTTTSRLWNGPRPTNESELSRHLATEVETMSGKTGRLGI